MIYNFDFLSVGITSTNREQLHINLLFVYYKGPFHCVIVINSLKSFASMGHLKVNVLVIVNTVNCNIPIHILICFIC